MAVDFAHKETDVFVDTLENKIAGVYKEATNDMKVKLEKFLADYDEQNKKKKAMLAAGSITNDQYYDWITSKWIKHDWYNTEISQLSHDMTQANLMVQKYWGKEVGNIYALNYNYSSYLIENQTQLNLSYTLVDADTVENLVTHSNMKILPKSKLKIAKDLKWNNKHLVNALTQGILQGESIPAIVKRFEAVVGMNHSAAVRNARTACTMAENSGRIESYKRAKAMGINLKKEWLATLDQKTRHSHRLVDGEAVAVSGKFSNGCKFPGDPDAPGAEVYNCRCTMVASIKGYDQSDAPRWSDLGDMTYEEWKGVHADGTAAAQAAKATSKKTTKAKKTSEKSETKYTQTSADMYSQKRKDEALWANNPEEADKSLRTPFSKSWRAATKEQRRAAYQYTTSDYEAMNESLRGKSLTSSDRHLSKNINELSDFIDTCDYDFDMWAQRGNGWNGSASFLGVSKEFLQTASDDDLAKALLGKSCTELGFMSFGDSKGSGFDSKPVIFNGYMPKEISHYMYAEPFSRFGRGTRSPDWDGITGQDDFGGEAEVLANQGSIWRVTKVRRSSNHLYVDIEQTGWTEEKQKF